MLTRAVPHERVGLQAPASTATHTSLAAGPRPSFARTAGHAFPRSGRWRSQPQLLCQVGFAICGFHRVHGMSPGAPTLTRAVGDWAGRGNRWLGVVEEVPDLSGDLSFEAA